MAIVNPLTNISYTNKDFVSIYRELLDLTKQLTTKWDPSISNESDPGVVLLKLCAIIGDKLNYNIDSNILEMFPSSASQPAAARNLYKQLAYNMRWYNGAASDLVSISWTGNNTELFGDYGDEVSKYTVKIPKFSMVCDTNNANVFTIVDTSDINIPLNGTPVYVSVVQGTIKDLTVNYTNIITLSSLDNRNRIYFSDQNVAENGIFISNYGSFENYDEWKQVKNITVDELDDTPRVYTFGVDTNTNLCYIEFAETISDVIGAGLTIKYITTDGANGNISSGVLSKFYTTQSNELALSTGNTVTIELTETNTYITNSSAIINGKDPESLSEAYYNFELTNGTFETLVTLRDYMNVLNTDGILNGYTSQAVVCDRTNDPQVAYTAVGKDGDVKHYVELTSGNEPKMKPFDLKMYLLENVDIVDTAQGYDRTFRIDTSGNERGQNLDAISLLDDYKSIQHNFIGIEQNKLCGIRLKYNITCSIYPNTTISDVQAAEIKENIVSALYLMLNSKKIKYGENIDYSSLKDLISVADSRISTVILNDLEYVPYKVYIDSAGNYSESKLNENSISSVNSSECEIYAKSILAGYTPLFKECSSFKYSVATDQLGLVKNIKKITTSVDLPVPNSADNFLAVPENCSIVLYYPNIETEKEYSSGVHYVYVNNNTGAQDFKANSNRTLVSNEYIAMIYTKDSSDNAAYYCNVITAGDSDNPYYVNSSVDLTRINANSSSLIQRLLNLSNKGEIMLNGSEWKPFIEDTISEYTLSASGESVTFGRMQKAATAGNKSYYYYWQTNHIVEKNNKKYYRLFDSQPQENTEIILGTGEYFFYTDSSRESLNVLGPGTSIKFVRNPVTGYLGTNNDWDIEVIDGNILYESDFSMGDTYKFLTSSQASFSFVENAVVSLGDGSRLTIYDNVEQQSKPNFVFKSDGVYVNNSKLANLNNYGIQFSMYGTSETSVLSSPGNQLGIRGYSTLDVCMSNALTQTLNSTYNEKFVIYSGDTGETVTEIAPTSAYPIKIMSSEPLNISGGTNVSLELYDIFGNSYHPDMYYFKSNTLAGSHIVVYDNGEVYLSSGHPYTINFKLFDNSYWVLPIYTSSIDSAELSGDDIIKLGEDEEINTKRPRLLSDFNSSTNPTYDEEYETWTFALAKGYNYVVFGIKDVNGSANATVSLRLGSAGNIIVGNPMSFSDWLDSSQATIQEAIIQKINSLDIDKHFDYCHKVDDDVLIDNPIYGESFLDKNHLLNKFSLCKLNLEDSTIKIIKKPR